MEYSSNNVSVTPEILRRKSGGEYIVPVTITGFTNGVCKAGSPIDATGAVANTASAIGILLNDVYAENPNGSLLKAFGAVNLTNANANSGLTIAAEAKTALSKIFFE
jgi:hypothetical protein